MDDESFPRGSSTPAVVKQQKAEQNGREELKKQKRDRGGKMEDLFDNGEEPVVKKKKKIKALTDDENKTLAGRGGVKKTQRSFEVLPLTYDTIVKDLLSLGVIEQIHDRGMIVLMPGRTTGKVELDSISEPFTKQLEEALKGRSSGYHTLKDLFSVGQVVSVKVKHVGALDNGRGHHDIQLTLDPKELHANWSAPMIQPGLMMVGAVKSREDNGWQVDLGIREVTAFMPENEARLQNKKQDLLLGQLVYVKVIKVNGNGRALQVSMQMDKKPKPQNDLQPGGINYSLLLPGMTLQSFVEDVNETGLKVNADNLIALCHVDHLAEEWANPQASYVPPKDLTVKVLYVHPNLTTPYVTTRQDATPIRTTFKNLKNEELIENIVKVQVASTSNRGVLVRVGEEKRKGLLPLSSLGEGLFTCKEDIDKKFKKKNEFECRVMKYSPFENMYICSLKKQILETKYLRESQVPPGTVLRCVVTQLNEFGAAVQFDSSLKAFVPRTFMNEETFNLFQKKQTTWEKLRAARVIEFDREKNRLVLSFKKELVKSTGKVISSLGDAKVGCIGDGIVLRVESHGVLVKTIGGVKGFIPAKKFKAVEFYKEVNFMEHLSPGSVLRYQVEKIENDRGQLLLKPTEEEAVEEVKVEVEEVKEKPQKRKRKESGSSENENKKPIRKRRKNKKNKSKEDKEEVEIKTEDEEEEMDTEENSEEAEDIKPDLLEIKLEPENFWNEGDDIVKDEVEEVEVEQVEKKKENRKIKELAVTPAKQKESLSLTPSPIKKWLEAYEKGTFPKTEESREATFWIRLMDHYQESLLYDKVRKVARDALDYAPIAQQSELREAMKIWKRLFLFELEWGQDGDSERILREAIERTDKKYECYKMAAQSYERLGKIKEAEKIYRERITKECGSYVDGWINYAKLYFDGPVKNPEMARNVFHQATQSKLAQSQPNFITDLTYRFAILELYHGDQDKAKEMFRTVLTQHPKRIDIWTVYVQALIKMELYDRARTVFQEFFAMSWKPNKIKGMLGQYRKFETEHGTPESKAVMGQVIERTLNILTAAADMA